MNNKLIKKLGFGIVEIIIGSAIISTALFAIIFIAEQSIKISLNNVRAIQSSFLIEEGLEVARIIRDNNWGNYSGIDSPTLYYLSFSGSNWATSSANVYIDNIFERTITIDNIYRDSNDNIVEVGVLDPDTKKITINVSWDNRGSTTTVSASTIITNINEE